jgi:hypothetical protein
MFRHETRGGRAVLGAPQLAEEALGLTETGFTIATRCLDAADLAVAPRVEGGGAAGPKAG